MNETDTTLLRAASRGDRPAAGAYFSQNLPLLMGMARRIGGGLLDPDDLLSESITALLRLWADGRGPVEHVNAYLIQSMRNRMKDELKSPRSRVLPLDDDDAPPETAAAESMTRIELYREHDLVRRALDRLPADQRDVLVATVVDGRKPRELEEALGRPAAAIYSLSRRARLSLRRASLQLTLEEHAPEECLLAAGDLPETVPDDPDAGPAVRGVAHIRQCRRCRAAWARFSAMSAAFGIATLLVIGGLLVPVAPASASAAEDERGDDEQDDDEQDPGEQDDAGKDDGEQSDGEQRESGRDRDEAGRDRDDIGQDRNDTDHDGGDENSRGDGGRRPGERQGHGDALNRRDRPAGLTRRRLPVRYVLRFGGVLSLVAGTALIVSVGIAAMTHSLWFRTDVRAELEVTSQRDAPGTATLTIALSSGEASLRSFDLVLPAGVSLASAPDRWTCDGGDGSWHCLTESEQEDRVVLRLDDPGAAEPGGYALSFTARAGDRDLEGSATGPITAKKSVARAVLG